MRVEHPSAGVQSGPYCRGIRPGLPKHGLHRQRLIDALKLAMIGGAADARTTDRHAERK
jgi:hypothetical protein